MPDESALSAAQRGKIRRMSAPKAVDPAEQAGELNIVPFLDIITNVLMFVLASITVTFTVSLAVDPPRKPPGIDSVDEHSLNLTVIVARDGYFLKGRAASIGTGCRGVGSGAATLPRISASADESLDGQKYDVAGLTRCVRRLKDEVPGADTESQVLVTANPNVPFQEVVRVMDALRRDEKGELFPKVVFTVVK